MRFSVVVPAHNEEALLPRGLAAIAAAAQHVDGGVEVIVVANRCTDRTAAIARDAGAVVVESEARNIAAVRNAGAAAGTGEVVVTVDADCVMAPLALSEMDRLLRSGDVVGGGVLVRPERRSAGIAATYAFVSVLTFVTRLGGGMFWCGRTDFETIGGFDEDVLIGEDLEFARRLRTHGKQTGRRFTTLRSTPLIASCRKFDRFGDWHMFRMGLQLRQIRAVLRGTDTAWVDHYFFDFND